MDILLSRIIRYLNGVITDDRQYRTALFLVEHYQELRCKTLEEIVKESEYTEEDIMTFIGYLGYHDYEDFRERLMMDQDLRSSQMQLRLLHTDIDGMISSLHISGSKEDFLNLVDHLAEIIYENRRIILAGGYSPLSVTVDFQTDMISMGKQAIEYHQFDKNFKFKDTDVVFFLTATGRALSHVSKSLKEKGLCKSHIVLMTQNIKYKNYDSICADDVVHVLGTFDGIEFNYQIMRLFDLIRIRYYTKYFI